MFLFHFVGIKRPKKSSMGKIFNNKKKKIKGASLLLSHSFIQFFFLFPIEDNVKFKFGGREFILFVLKNIKKKNFAYDKIIVEISYNF